VIDQAVNILRRGGLVAFPTETVYGLGADATSAAAVQKIFTAKGRPATNPLIVHVADTTVAKRFTTAWPAIAQQLADRFWPGPLTLVVPKSDRICNAVSAGGSTVGLRVPDHPIALALLRGFDGPIAAPSANRANHISPTRAEHVRSELGQQVDLILDGGPCAVGIESTVLDLSRSTPRILRPGGVSREQIESIVGKVEVFTGSVAADSPANSPGQQARHYSPMAPTFRFETSQRAQVLQMPDKVAMLIESRAALPTPDVIMMPPEPQAYARVLYEKLREADARSPERICIEMPPDAPKWTAVRDRLMRATAPMIQ
jgi:L-threonylcarbamoyladenylate synthase